MKRVNSYVASAFLIAAAFCSFANAQGCGQISIDEGDITCCDGTETQPNPHCGGSGNPSYFCSEGSGECCGTEYQTTNVVYDPDECGGGGGCPTCGPCPPQFQRTSVGVKPDCSPIIIDTTGHGFQLTSANDGVVFDIAGDGHPIKLAWTARNSGNAFLALPHNGRVTSGKELFGNFTAQPPCPDGGRSCFNGYRALAEFDKLENGGNGDGIIDERDAVFSHLLLWIDENHDGISQPNELHTLPELGVYSISLHYRDDAHFFDQYGNWFHYQAALNPDPQDGESKDGRVTYDVFFVIGGGLAQPRVSGFPKGDCHGRMDFRHLLDDDLEIAGPGLGRSPDQRTCKENGSGGDK